MHEGNNNEKKSSQDVAAVRAKESNLRSSIISNRVNGKSFDNFFEHLPQFHL